MKIPGFIRNDFWRKLIALLFAAIVYLSIAFQLHEERVIPEIPVEVRASDPELILDDVPDIKTMIQVRGPKTKISELSALNFSAAVEIGEAERRNDGSYRVTLSAKNFHGPDGVRIKAVSPAELTLRLQRRITKKVPVKVRFKGRLSESFRIEKTEQIPNEVTVSGPENEVTLIREISTEPIPLSTEVEDSILYRAKLTPPPRSRVTPEQVEVQVSIETSGRVVIRKLPVALLCDRDAGFDVSFVEKNPSVDATLQIPASARSDFTPEKLLIYVDVTRLNSPGIHKVHAEGHVRGDAGKVLSIQPGEFEVKLARKNRK